MSEETPTRFALITTGTVAVKPRSDWSKEGKPPFVILLVGSTGSGKSSFIEALGNDKSLGISKDQLEGFTQTVTAYHIKNMVSKDQYGTAPVCLLDSPGFSDTNISEMEIIEQVRRWLEYQRLYVNIILYFCPINVTRIPGTQRRTIDMLKSLIGREDGLPGRFTIVTTMWDQVCNERLQKRAEDNLAYIREILFKDMIEGGSGLTTFTNTQESASTILDSCVKHSNKTEYTAINSVRLGRSTLCITPFGRQLYSDLLGRIEEAWVRKTSLVSELDSAQDPELNTLLQNQLKETSRILDKFALQLAEFGSAPEGMPAMQEDAAAYFRDKYGQQQLYYAAVLGPLEDGWEEKLIWEAELGKQSVIVDPDYTAKVEDWLSQATHQLPNLAKKLAEFGPPPDGVSGPQGDLAAYVESKPWLLVKSLHDTDSESPQPTSLAPDTFGEDGDPYVSAVDVTSELDVQPHLHELPEESGAPQPLHPDTGSAPRPDTQSKNVDITTASTTRLHTPQLEAAPSPPSEPAHQSTSFRSSGASGAKQSRLRRFLARLFFWRK
ncbi:hypothetical protein CVT24_004182 [Panaeolus cyanescens]|uniref:G domain-containing protein n=1 Tax=Panaeolus cyanescens TaxID=181874 RepID=A0A409YXA3_9AGAR|nr:hypothetical protein CVT24_004182 [Panaeolus cyanescens]